MILITGVNGFIGKHLFNFYKNIKGEKVLGFDKNFHLSFLACPYITKLQNQSGVLANISILIRFPFSKRWRLHSFDFAFGLASCGCRQRQMCAMCVGIEFFRAETIFLFFFRRVSP